MNKVINGLSSADSEVLYNKLKLSDWFDCYFFELEPRISNTDLTDAAISEMVRLITGEQTIKDNFIYTKRSIVIENKTFSLTCRQCIKNGHVYEPEFDNKIILE